MILSNTNGIATNLYYLLWIKNQEFLDKKSINVRIPDTLILRGSQILFWFFTGSNGELLQKKTASLTPEEIYKGFQPDKQNRSGILAQLMTDNKQIPVLRSSFKQKQSAPKSDEKIVIHYFRDEELKKYLFEDFENQSYNQEAILQRFIDPPGDYNNVIETLWSQSTCLFTRRINNTLLSNIQQDPYERAVTFDGPEIFSKVICLKGQKIQEEMRQVCDKIIKKVQRVSYDKVVITRMILFFKLDSHSRLNFMYCSCMRLAKERIINDPPYFINHHRLSNTPLSIDNNFEQPPNMRNTYSLSLIQTKYKNDIHCQICMEMCQEQDITQLPLKHLLFQKDLSKVKSESLQKQEKEQNLSPINPIDEEDIDSPEKSGNMKKQANKKKDENKLTQIIPTQYQVWEHLASKGSNISMPTEYLSQKNLHSHPIIKRLYPHMTPEYFLRLLSADFFDCTTIHACHSCFLHFTRNNPIACAPVTPSPQNPHQFHHKIQKPLIFNNKIQKKLLEKSLELSSVFPKSYASNANLLSKRLSLISSQDQNKNSSKKDNQYHKLAKVLQNNDRISNSLVHSKQSEHKQTSNKSQESFQQLSHPEIVIRLPSSDTVEESEPLSPNRKKNSSISLDNYKNPYPTKISSSLLTSCKSNKSMSQLSVSSSYQELSNCSTTIIPQSSNHLNSKTNLLPIQEDNLSSKLIYKDQPSLKSSKSTKEFSHIFSSTYFQKKIQQNSQNKECIPCFNKLRSNNINSEHKDFYFLKPHLEFQSDLNSKFDLNNTSTSSKLSSNFLVTPTALYSRKKAVSQYSKREQSKSLYCTYNGTSSPYNGSHDGMQTQQKIQNLIIKEKKQDDNFQIKQI